MVVDALEYLPGYARSGDAGADLRITESVTLQPGERRLVGTGVRIALPAGTFGMVTPDPGRPRSVAWESSTAPASSIPATAARSASA